MKIRVVSLVHPHMTFWHSVERALGYGAAALEGGFGFIQYFLHPYHRCAQDRLAETIVVTEGSYRAAFPHPAHSSGPTDRLLKPNHRAPRGRVRSSSSITRVDNSVDWLRRTRAWQPTP